MAKCSGELETIDQTIEELRGKIKGLSLVEHEPSNVTANVEIPPDLASNQQYVEMVHRMAAMQEEIAKFAAEARKDKPVSAATLQGAGTTEDAEMEFELDMASYMSAVEEKLPKDLSEEIKQEILKRMQEAPPPAAKRQKQSSGAASTEPAVK